MKHFYDIETQEVITEKELQKEFEELKASDPETYSYSFQQYIKNCTDKNGTLKEI